MEDFEAKYKKRIETLSDTEKGRKEQHGTTRIIYNREISPVQMFQNVIDNTSFVFKNRVVKEGKKVIHKLKGIRGRRSFGIAIQLTGFLMSLISLYIALNFNYKEWYETAKHTVIAAFFIGTFIFPFVGGFIRCSGRRYYFDYIKNAGSEEINCLQNGQLVVIKYMDWDDHSRGSYRSALNLDDTEYNEGKTVWIPSCVVCMYIIDSVKSCTRTKKGLMIESSGRYYGERDAFYKQYQNQTAPPTAYQVTAEAQVLYRKEEILDIFTNMDQLEAMLMSYGSYDDDRYKFYPL